MKYFTVKLNNSTMAEIQNMAGEFGSILDAKRGIMPTTVFKFLANDSFIDLMSKAFMEGKYHINFNEVRNIRTPVEMTNLCNECKSIAKLADKYLKNKEKYRDIFGASL